MSDDTRAREMVLDAIQSADRALELCSCKSEIALTEFLTERVAAALTEADLAGYRRAMREAAEVVNVQFDGTINSTSEAAEGQDEIYHAIAEAIIKTLLELRSLTNDALRARATNRIRC